MEEIQKKFLENEDIRKLPEGVQKKLADFMQEIPKVPYFKPDGKPKKEWKIFYGKTWDPAWDAAWDAARGAAWDAAGVAAWDAAGVAAKDAAGDAAGVAAWDAAGDAARGAAWDAAGVAAGVAARDAAGVAAWDAAWDAARGAALYTDYIIVSDLKFKNKAKHLKHAKARWEVWQKGYGLLCDVDGVLYVYCIESNDKSKYPPSKYPHPKG